MKKDTEKSPKSLFLEYESVFAPMGRNIMNRARLAGRELERNVANITGHGEKIAKMAPHVFNPFTDTEGMKNIARDMNQKIEDRLENGNLLLSFLLTQELEIEDLIKRWLLYLKVIEPISLDEKIKSDIKKYLI